MEFQPVRITGHLVVEKRRNGRVWVASFIQADGGKTRRTLGPAWARESGRKTARGTPIYRAANGSKPSPEYLTPKEAADRLDALLAAERAKPRPSRRRGEPEKTVGQVLDGWLSRAEAIGNKQGPLTESTLVDYRSLVRRVRAEFDADAPASTITTEAVKDYQLRLQTEPSPRTGRPLGQSQVRKVMQRFHQAWAFALEEGWIEDDPVARVALPPAPKIDPDFNVLEPSQVELVATAVGQLGIRDAPIMRNGQVDEWSLSLMRQRAALDQEAVRVLAYTGLRAGELRALRWRNVDVKRRTLRVVRANASSSRGTQFEKTPKGMKGRAVPLIPAAIDALERVARIAGKRDPMALVFPTFGGMPIDTGRLRDAFYGGLYGAGLGHLREKEHNPMTLHDLRHTFGTIAARTFPLQDVQAFLGHADIKTTMRYLHHVPRADAAERLAAAFAEDFDKADDVWPEAI